jgi:glycosyltransferase involved in cell wall biosynthesis
MCVSVLILTLNEETNLPGCLKSVSWSDDIVVFDSFSTDRTVEIARAAGAKVFQRKFDNYAAQRNAALTEVKYEHPWVLMVDADERWDSALYEKMVHAIRDSKNKDISVFCFTHNDIFMGRWLHHSLASTTWAGRLVRVGSVSVKRDINEEYHTEGQKAYLRCRFLHYPLSKGIAFWFERHNRYSSMEANVLVRETEGKLELRGMLSSDPTIRRKWLKQLAYRMPFRPFLVFCYLYFFRLGFLDGIPGLTYCRLRSMYEYMIDLKVKELRREDRSLTM